MKTPSPGPTASREVVQQKRMPPWLADPHFGKFQNDRSLADADRTTLLAWIDQGCPKGDPADLPPEKRFAEGWRIGKPDVVFTMPDEYTVPADAGPRGVKYQYFIVETHFDEDRWIQAAEARPGNPAVVHHIIVYVVKPGFGGLMREKTGDGIGDGFLTAFAPGELGTVLAPGTAKHYRKAPSSLSSCTTRPTASSRRTDRRSDSSSPRNRRRPRSAHGPSLRSGSPSRPATAIMRRSPKRSSTRTPTF